MPPTLTSRQDSRKKIAELLAEITTLVAVYDHQTKDFGRRSPVAMVHSDGSRTSWTDYAREWHRFIVTLLWGRDDAEDTEDRLDNLARDVRQKLYDNSEIAGFWEDLIFDNDEFSEMDYFLLDGKLYRRELLRVTVYSVCDNT